jgi:small-conductance mechanosensitive channel
MSQLWSSWLNVKRSRHFIRLLCWVLGGLLAIAPVMAPVISPAIASGMTPAAQAEMPATPANEPSVLVQQIAQQSPSAASPPKSTPRVPVVIDGRVLLRVGASSNYNAEERATVIRNQLLSAIVSAEPPSVSIGEQDGLPVVIVNDNVALTVTSSDTFPGQPASEQAELWAERIERVLEQSRQERSPGYVQTSLAWAFAIVIATIVIQWGFRKLWQSRIYPALEQRFFPPDPTHESNPSTTQPVQHRIFDAGLNLLLLLLRSGIWLTSIIIITDRFPWTRSWNYYIRQSLVAVFTSPSIDIGRTDYSISDLLLLLVSVIVLFILSRNVTDLFRARVLALTGVNRGAQATISIILRYTLVFFGSLSLMQIWGIDISSLAILASSLGIGIGFGLQDIAKNFGSGLVLVFERPIQVGDFVEVGDFQGTVEHIGARSTLIRTLDQVSIIVPNSRFLENEVINWSLGNPVSRIRIPVGVAYGSDIEIVKTAFLEAARGHRGVLSTPPPQVFFMGFGDSSLDFEVMVWTAEPSKQIRLRSDLYFSIEALLRQYNVEIPFPQRDLHVRSGRLPIALSPETEQLLQQLLRNRQNGYSDYSDYSDYPDYSERSPQSDRDRLDP